MAEQQCGATFQGFAIFSQSAFQPGTVQIYQTPKVRSRLLFGTGNKDSLHNNISERTTRK
jgi:hypothetical protein